MSEDLVSSEAPASQATASTAVAEATAAPAPAASSDSSITVDSIEPAVPGSKDVPADWAGVDEAESFASVLHSMGVENDLVRQMLNEYDDVADAPTEVRDAEHKAECLAALRSYWTPEQVEANLELVKTYLQSNLPDGVARLIGNASFGGRLILNNPETVIALVSVARSAPRVPPPTGDVDRDIRAIEMVMRTDPDKYRADTGLQLRLRSLYSKRLVRQRRSGHAG